MYPSRWVASLMQKLLDPDKVANDALKRIGRLPDGPDYRKLGHLGTGLQPMVGAVEILLYPSSIVFGYPQFIAVWIGTKYVASYKTWGTEPVGRTFYNRSLFGSGVNILVGAATGGIARLAMHNQSQCSSFWETARIFPKGGTMLQLVVGGIITILTAVIVEYLRKPRLKFSIETPPLDVDYGAGRPAKDVRYLRLNLLNEALPGPLRWLQRAPAMQCRGNITFHHFDDGQDVFGRTMAGRWKASPEPLPIQAITGRRRANRNIRPDEAHHRMPGRRLPWRN